jgi:hemoglobin
MHQFWCSVLLGSAEYSGNPMQKHVALSQCFSLEHHHFNAWIALWNETIDDLFTGPKAKNAKVQTQSIAEIMRFKVGAK